jgi:hypothetical protein
LGLLFRTDRRAHAVSMLVVPCGGTPIIMRYPQVATGNLIFSLGDRVVTTKVPVTYAESKVGVDYRQHWMEVQQESRALLIADCSPPSESVSLGWQR